ncbi:MAG: hypothetical protein ACI4R9_01490 [Kiritimatiellia bacterium]
MSSLFHNFLLPWLIVLPTVQLFALEVTNVVDIAALAACQTGLTNGWEIAGLDSYTDSTVNIRLNATGEYALSPDFGATILRIEMKLHSSCQSGRKLAFIPMRNGEEFPADGLLCDYSPNKDTFVAQTIEVPATNVFSRFKLTLTEANNSSTGWGVSQLSVITSDGSAARGPENLTVARIYADRFTAIWEAPEGAVSNEVVVTREDYVPFSADFIDGYNYTFDKFSNDKTLTDLTDKFVELYPDFSGERLYAPTNSSGIVRLGSSDYRGELVFKGYSDYSGLSLVVCAKKGATAKYAAPVAWMDESEGVTVTNIIGTITATTNAYEHFVIPLDGVPDDEELHIFSCVGDFQTKSNTQLFVDSVGLARRAVAAHTKEVTILRTFTTQSRLTVRSLAPSTIYHWQARSYLGDGSITAWSSRQTAATTDEPPDGLALHIH